MENNQVVPVVRAILKKHVSKVKHGGMNVMRHPRIFMPSNAVFFNRTKVFRNFSGAAWTAGLLWTRFYVSSATEAHKAHWLARDDIYGRSSREWSGVFCLRGNSKWLLAFVCSPSRVPYTTLWHAHYVTLLVVLSRTPETPIDIALIDVELLLIVVRKFPAQAVVTSCQGAYE